jgi:ribonuclease P/MRP protein subunit RPP38
MSKTSVPVNTTPKTPRPGVKRVEVVDTTPLSAKKQNTTTIFKNLYASPFNVTWPKLDEASMQLVKIELANAFQGISMRAPRQRASTQKESRSAPVDTNTNEPAEPAAKRRKIEGTDDSASAQVKQIRSELVFGLNQVTRGLEKESLKLVIVSKDIQAQIVIQHLPVLAQLHHTPLCLLDLSSEELGAVFGLRTVIAVGVKNKAVLSTPRLDELVTKIIKRTPPVQLDWLPNDSVKVSQDQQPLQSLQVTKMSYQSKPKPAK